MQCCTQNSNEPFLVGMLLQSCPLGKSGAVRASEKQSALMEML